jgi:hypothetical protein
MLSSGRKGKVQVKGTVLFDRHDLQHLTKVRLRVRATRKLGVSNVLVRDVRKVLRCETLQLIQRL